MLPPLAPPSQGLRLEYPKMVNKRLAESDQKRKWELKKKQGPARNGLKKEAGKATDSCTTSRLAWSSQTRHESRQELLYLGQGGRDWLTYLAVMIVTTFGVGADKTGSHRRNNVVLSLEAIRPSSSVACWWSRELLHGWSQAPDGMIDLWLVW